MKKIFILIFLIMTSKMAWAQLYSDEALAYAEIRCEEIKSAGFIEGAANYRSCQHSFAGRFMNHLFLPEFRNYMSSTGKTVNLLQDEYTIFDPNALCRTILTQAWFGKNWRDSNDQKKQDCMNFYTKKKQEALGQK